MDYVLTEGDKLLLQNLIRDVENLKARIARLTSNEQDDPWPTGGYLGRTTTSITGLAEEPGTAVLDRPGCGFVDIYKAVLYPAVGTGGAGPGPNTGTGSQFTTPCDVDYELRKVGRNIRVLNLNSEAINSDVWVWVEQDRYGNFWAFKATIKTKCIDLVTGIACDPVTFHIIQSTTKARVFDGPTCP